jgi:hypothetical protein
MLGCVRKKEDCRTVTLDHLLEETDLYNMWQLNPIPLNIPDEFFWNLHSGSVECLSGLLVCPYLMGIVEMPGNALVGQILHLFVGQCFSRVGSSGNLGNQRM